MDSEKTFCRSSAGMTDYSMRTKKTRVEHVLVKYHLTFARHQLDIVINTEFKAKPTPQHDKMVWSQNFPAQTNLKDYLFVELALMQDYGFLSTLLFSSAAHHREEVLL